MKTTQFYIRIKRVVLSFLLASLVLSCGSFQGASYFESDGIYASQTVLRSERPQATTDNNNYYTQYFKSAAEEGYVEPAADEVYFTDNPFVQQFVSRGSESGIEFPNSLGWSNCSDRNCFN